MAKAGLQERITDQLKATNVVGGYTASIVCTHTGLLIASDGEAVSDEMLAGFTSLFDDIVVRAQRDLELAAIDEVSIFDASRGRLVIRPVNEAGTPRLFLVVKVPPKATWRRHTNRLLKRLGEMMEPMLTFPDDGEDEAAPDAQRGPDGGAVT